MDKNTLSNYGWIVIAVLVLSVMIALATPFGEYIKAGVESTTAGLFDTSEKAMNVVGMSAETRINHNGRTIPRGAVYIVSLTGKTLSEGAVMPDSVADGDIYTYGDYKYTYETMSNGWKVEININVTNKKQNCYGVILESINSNPITNMKSTFYGCDSLITAPEIPSSVTKMAYTFQGCTKLTTVQKIPNGVLNMNGTFSGCKYLTTIPKIPNSVTTIQSTFENCTSLTTAPEIPSSVKYMQYSFAGCTSLTGNITINANPTNWTQCLYNTQITAVVGETTMADDIILTKTSTTTNPTA